MADRSQQGLQRREAFRRLLDLAREDDYGKLRLAEKAWNYFSDFPDYQDEAINDLYDMCEGQNQEVRSLNFQLEHRPRQLGLILFRLESPDTNP